jgi:hypothetical protein
MTAPDRAPPQENRTMATYEIDGYQDAINGRACSPPSHPETMVFTDEYRRGYNAGRLFRAREDGRKPSALDPRDPDPSREGIFREVASKK